MGDCHSWRANVSLSDMVNLPFLAEIQAFRRQIHAAPELAFAEHKTSEVVASALRSMGMDVHTRVGGTGVVGVLKRGNSPRSIALRADMDALPIQEANSFGHASKHPGVMHACGHDGHTAVLLGAARYLSEFGDFDGTVVFIFQPAEEGAGGASRMIDDGLFSRFPVDAIYGLHNWPGLPVGQVAVHAGPVMAGTAALDIRVRGRGCHAAMPQQGVDPILISSHLIQAFQSVVSREVHPCDAAVVSITQITAGDTWNVIPGEVRMRGTIRAFKDDVFAQVEGALHRIAKGIADAFRAEIEVRLESRHPPTVNSLPEAELARRAAVAAFGEASVKTLELPSMGAEDFSFMLREKPGCYIWLGNGPGEGGCTLHNPAYDFNDEAIAFGISYWASLVATALSNSSRLSGDR